MSNFDISGKDRLGTPTPLPVTEGSVSAFRPQSDTAALRALQTIVEPGTRIDHFQVGKLLGRGGMAAVYEGTDTSTAQPVALKILDARFTSDPQMVARFLAEGEKLADFRHPNIVSYVAHGVDDCFAYLAMELVNGITLDQLIHAIEIKPHHITHLAREIGKGLTTIHAAGLFHGDIKPSNILVTRAGDVKITDFGTAALSHASRANATKVSGTAAYIAPELLVQKKSVDYRADIFSLGVTFYKVLTGRVPADPVVPAPSLNPGLPGGTDVVLQRAMQQIPDRRFTTANEFCDAIAALFDENALTTPVSGPIDNAEHAIPGEGDLRRFSGNSEKVAAAPAEPGIKWNFILLCCLAAIGLAATLLVLAAYFGQW